MSDFGNAVLAAAHLIWTLDPELVQIVGLSLVVSVTAVALAALLGLPAGAALALVRFAGRGHVIALVNALMGLPPVVVGLAVYLLLSHSGALGGLGLLFTPAAMVIAQMIVVTPIIAALTRQVVEDLWVEYRELLSSLRSSLARSVGTLLWDGRYTLGTAVLAGFGRAVGEVGAIIIVGGNIRHVTRTMTTAIVLETSKGDLALAMGLGLILVVLSILINAGVYWAQEITKRVYG